MSAIMIVARILKNPDHPKELIAQRKKARDQKIFMRFLMLSPKAQDYYRQLEQRRINTHQHIMKIVALSEIYGVDPVARAIEDAFILQAFSSEYIANILEQRGQNTKRARRIDPDTQSGSPGNGNRTARYGRLQQNFKRSRRRNSMTRTNPGTTELDQKPQLSETSVYPRKLRILGQAGCSKTVDAYPISDRIDPVPKLISVVIAPSSAK